MLTSNDRLFCLLTFAASNDGVSIRRLNCYYYILQSIGVSFDFKFKINTSGLKSRNLGCYIEEQVSIGVVTQNRGMIHITSDSEYILSSFVMSFSEIEFINSVRMVLSDLTDDELYLVCVTDILINDLLKTKGVDALYESRGFIESSVSELCSAYTEDNFTHAVGLIQGFKKEFNSL